MNRLSVVVDASSNLHDIRSKLRDAFELHFYGPDQVDEIEPAADVLFDIDILNCARLIEIKDWMGTRQRGGKVIFAVDKSSWHAQAQAAAFGASGVIDRPVDGQAVVKMLFGDFRSLTDNKQPPLLRSISMVAPMLDALENIFMSIQLGSALDLRLIELAGNKLIGSIADAGIGSWINTVRMHHSQTYQHSLLVTGVIVAFAQKMRMSDADQLRLSLAAMLHDIGKARIPVSILEKPDKLDHEESEVMRRHPELGWEGLTSATGVDDEILDAVLHHHETLDGSGYPHGLKCGQISDLVRIVTLSDIFGALIERRSYKKAMPCADAYAAMLDMGPRLDADLRREFGFVAKLHVEP